MPAQWVPFSADVEIVHDGSKSTGAFHRRNDGSNVWILETSLGTAITIHNFTAQRSYVKLGSGGWKSYLLDHNTQVRPQPELRLWSKEITITKDPTLGDVIEHTKNGQVTRVAPALNGVRLSSKRPDGAGEELTNVRIGNPPDNLFVPPTGVQVEENSREILPAKPQPQAVK